jgi:hypothetical protein
VDAEKLFGASGGVTALRVGPHGGSRLRGFGLHAKAAPQWFRVAALSEVPYSAFSLFFFRFTVLKVLSQSRFSSAGCARYRYSVVETPRLGYTESWRH